MPRSTPAIFLLLFGLSPATSLAATVTPAQLCESAIEQASARFAQCRLTAESKFAKTLDAAKRTTAVARCSDKLKQAFDAATLRYGLNCTSEVVEAFDAYLTQCSDDVVDASTIGGSLPNYNAEISACRADRDACTASLAQCQESVVTCGPGTALDTVESKCVPTCGNAAVDEGEDCDLGTLGGNTCEGLGFASGALRCAPGCTFDTSGCFTCGNETVEPSEDCDGSNLDSSTCDSLGLTGGILACNGDCTFDTSGCLSNTWATMGSAPARQWAAAATANGKIYLIGGLPAPSNTVHEYDLATNTWTSRAPMPTARYAMGVVALNGKLYAIGGRTPTEFLAVVEEYDPASDSWTGRAPMPTARIVAVGAVDNKIYAIGGSTDGVQFLSTVEEFSPDTNSWTTRASLPTPRTGLAIAIVDGKLFAVGGAVDSSDWASGAVEQYDPVLDTWVSKSPLPNPRYALAAAAVAGRIYVFGGDDTDNADPEQLDIYDVATDGWSAGAAMPTPRWALGSAVAGGRIYAITGSLATGGLSTAFDQYTP